MTSARIKKHAGFILRYITVYGIILILFMLDTIALPYPYSLDIKPSFFFMALYYWAVYRPTLIPPLLIFAAGIIADTISGLPLGLNTLIFILFQWASVSQRRLLAGQSFIVIWTGFALLFTGALTLKWAAAGIILQNQPAATSLIASAGVSVALFPAIYSILHMTHKVLPLATPLKLFKGQK